MTQEPVKQYFVVWPDIFTPAELDAIEEIGDTMMRVGQGAAPASTRLAWLERDERSAVVYDRLNALVPRINQQFYKFDVMALEKIQYGLFQGGEGPLLDWHMDYDERGAQSRKISVRIPLTDPSHYEGGEIELKVGAQLAVLPRTRGSVIAFPSYFLHRVAHITSGACNMLVTWAVGPEFH